MLTKLQIGFCVAAGVGIVIFTAGIFSNINVARMPVWLAPVIWGSFILVIGSCIGVVATMVLDREREPGDDDDEEAELLPDDPLSDEPMPELTTQETAVPATIEPSSMEFAEPGSEEMVEFSTLPDDE